MSLGISIRERDGVTIMDLNGRIVFGDGTEELSTATTRLLAEGRKKLLVNFAEVRQVDTVGLGSLTSCYANADEQSAELKLLKPIEHLNNLLVITRLVTLFDSFDDEEEAINSFITEAGTVG